MAEKMAFEAAAAAMREAIQETVKRHSMWYLGRGLGSFLSRSAISLSVMFLLNLASNEVVGQEFKLCARVSNGNVRAIPVQEDCTDLAGNWIQLNLMDDDWVGAGTGSLQTGDENDSVVVGPPSGAGAKLTVNAGQNEEVFRARANNVTALFIGGDGQTGIRNAQPQAALHVGAVSGENPLRIDRFGTNDPQLLVTSQGNVGINVGQPSDKLSVLNSGSGRAGFFQTNNSANRAAALSATTNGSGSAVFANILNGDSTSPTLQAIHSGGRVAGAFEGQLSVTRNNHQIRIRDQNNAFKEWTITSHQASSGIGIWENGQGGTGRFVVNAGGNIGIGTLDPIARLHVEGSNDLSDVFVRDSVFARMRMVATNPANDVTLSVQARGSQGAERAEIGTVSNHGMVLFTNGSTRISLGSSGAVCIGNC
jgi:hypothetical protein